MTIEYPKEILGDIYEAHEFLKKHGQVGVAERERIIRNSLDFRKEETRRLEDFEKKYELFSKKLKNLPEMRRLKRLKELAGTVNVHDKPHYESGVEIHLPAFHSRYDHGELCAEQVKFAGVKLGLPDEDIAILYTAATLHDIGHPALSHIGDYFLEKKGKGNHEERGVAIILDEKKEIYQLLKENGISPEAVAETVQEKGYLGAIQSLFDTVSYLVVDSEMMQMPIFRDRGARFVQDLQGIDKEKGLLRVGDAKLWQWLLEIRAEMMSNVYLHPAHRRQRAAMRHLMQIAINKGHLTLSKIETGVDKDVELLLQSLVQKDRGAAMFSGRKDATPYLDNYLELWGLANGEYEPKLWQGRMFEDREKMDAFLYENISSEVLEQTVVVEPFDYTRKKLSVIDKKTGKETILKSQNVKLRDWDTNYIAYIPKFLKRGK